MLEVAWPTYGALMNARWRPPCTPLDHGLVPVRDSFYYSAFVKSPNFLAVFGPLVGVSISAFLSMIYIEGTIGLLYGEHSRLAIRLLADSDTRWHRDHCCILHNARNSK